MGFHTVLGTCHHDCPDSCGWVATVDDDTGRAVKLRGNPAHPYSRGELCPKVNRYLDRVYSPDRILTPLVRTGPKGEGRFEPTTWEHALAVTAERIHAAVAEHGGETVWPYHSAGTQGLLQMNSLSRRLFTKLGATRSVGNVCGLVAGVGTTSALGSGRGAEPTDVRHAELVLLWGTNTLLTNRHLWPFVEEARANNGATVVVIDPVRTATAESADWFVQPRPGTDVALMLAMIHVLVRDDLIDHEYVAAHTVGYEQLAAHVAGWTPERAAAECGIDAAEIERLGRAYGSTRRAFIRTLIGAEHHENGAMFYRTLSCLPALTGAWRERGGGFARSVGAWSHGDVDDSVFDAPHLAPAGPARSFNVNHLGRVLTGGDGDLVVDPPVTVFVNWGHNPVVTIPNAGLIRRGLARDDLFTVVSEQFLTETARYADVIFPAATQLENLDVVTSWGHLNLGWNEPAIAPRGEAVANTELWRRLAGALGFTEPELFESDEVLLAGALRGVDVERLRADGFVRLSLPQPLLPYAEGGFATPSGKVLLYSEELERAGLPGLPTYVPPTQQEAAAVTSAGAVFPLTLLSPKQHTRFINSSYSTLPGHQPIEGAPFVELDEADALDRGLADGDAARVWNRRGTLTLPVKISKRLRPGVVAVPYGWWGTQHADGVAVNHLTSDTLTDWGGGVAYNDTLVEVARA